MKVYNNEITIHRGETFTIDRLLLNKDNSPYIITPGIEVDSDTFDDTCRFLLSVSRDYYGVSSDTSEQYLYNVWLKPELQFAFINAIDLMAFTEGPSVDTPKYPNGYSDITKRDSSNYVVSGYYKGELIPGVSYNDYLNIAYGHACVFYVEDADGNRDYRYFAGSSDEITWYPYKCRFNYTFTQEITKDWIAQNYLYSISLIYGTLKDNPASDEDPFEIKDAVIPILPPTKLTVLNTLNGGF